MKIKTVSLAIFLLCIGSFDGIGGTYVQVAQQIKANQDTVKVDPNRFDYVKAIGVIGAAIRNVQTYFVDTVSIDALYKRGLDAMLGGLDPYTEYYSAEDTENLRLATTGEYAGIGALIMPRSDSTVMIAEPIQGQPADLAGVKAGDVILKIDGKDYTHGTTSALVSAALKGMVGSNINLVVRRLGESKPLTFVFKRRTIQVPPVSYYGILPNTRIGYIFINTFNDKTAAETSNALRDLKVKGIEGLILDLRSNGGGVVQEGIKIVNFFVPEGREVMSLRGRDESIASTYRTLQKPLDTEIPLCVLVNAETASTSEIVAGALQDMDRAVVVGRKTFGKGLVQSTRQLPYGGVIKLTTAKYYIPSGRCIQQVDFHASRLKGRLVEVPDSLRHVFYTSGGRPVRDAGGILPDTMVKNDTLPAIVYYMHNNTDVFDFVTDYKMRHKAVAEPEQFSISDEEYARLVDRLEEKKFSYDLKSTELLSGLERVARLEGLIDAQDSTFIRLRADLQPNLRRDMQKFRTNITDYIDGQILRRYYYSKGSIRRSLLTDNDLKAAISILQDDKRYRSILAPVSKQLPPTQKDIR